MTRNFNVDLTDGSITGGLIRFSVPLMLGNILQQFYNIADTLIVGRYIGKEALAAVGSAYSLMIFLTSVILGLSMGSGAFLSIQHGNRDTDAFSCGNFMAFVSIGIFTVMLNAAAYIFTDNILVLLQVPDDVYPLIHSYIRIIFGGIAATFLYNYFASCLRAVGNSVVPLIFLGISAVMNIVLDLVFVAVLGFGIEGAAAATVIAQYFSGIGIAVYAFICNPELRFRKENAHFRRDISKRIFSLSLLTSLQQSIMNFGILMVQGIVNSFGTTVMAAFSAAVKIDTLAYSPVQDFGNAFSTFTAQNNGAGKSDRIKKGTKTAFIAAAVFCAVISAAVFIFAEGLMSLFAEDSDIIAVGASYLRIEGAFYCLIGFLFLFYGYFRAIEHPFISVILTAASLGTRVALSYILSGIDAVGYYGIWWSIPIGWALADIAGLAFMLKKRT